MRQIWKKCGNVMKMVIWILATKVIQKTRTLTKIVTQTNPWPNLYQPTYFCISKKLELKLLLILGEIHFYIFGENWHCKTNSLGLCFFHRLDFLFGNVSKYSGGRNIFTDRCFFITKINLSPIFQKVLVVF